MKPSRPTIPAALPLALLLAPAALAQAPPSRPVPAQAVPARPAPAPPGPAQPGQVQPGQAAGAPPRPSMAPTRDVAVTYRITGAGGGTGEMRAAWLAAEDRSRLEPPGAPGWILVERRAGRAVLVMDAQRIFLRLPPEMAAGMTLDLPPGIGLTRAGEARVAGEACTEWQAHPPQGRTTLCVTADGVMLRTVTLRPGGGENRMEATALRYGPQDPARFRVPAGYAARDAPPPLVPQRR